MKAFVLVLLLAVAAGFAQCSDYYQKAASLASSCDFHSILPEQPNVYHCFESGKSYVSAAECVGLNKGDPEPYYEKALYYLKNSIPKLSEVGDYFAKARAYENIARVYKGKGELSLAEENYQLAVKEYVLAGSHAEADRVRQLIASLGVEQKGSEEAGIVNPEVSSSAVPYYFMIAVSATVLGMFLLLTFRSKKKEKAPEIKVKHTPAPEPVKRAEKEAKDAKERAKEKLRKKYAPRK